VHKELLHAKLLVISRKSASAKFGLQAELWSFDFT
jgi:hypothetical protein